MRSSRTPDFGRIAATLAGPGMDTRWWAKIGIVSAVTLDPAEGVFVDLVLAPEGDKITARYCPIYGGSGFGLYMPLRVDDEVLVLCPSGQPAEGALVIGGPWSPSDPPPAEANNGGAPSQDVTLHVRDGQSLRVRVTGAGTVNFQADGAVNVVGGSVNLGANAGDAALQPVPRGDDLETRIANLEAAFIAHRHALMCASTSPFDYLGVTTSPQTEAICVAAATQAAGAPGPAATVDVVPETLGTPAFRSSIVNTGGASS